MALSVLAHSGMIGGLGYFMFQERFKPIPFVPPAVEVVIPFVVAESVTSSSPQPEAAPAEAPMEMPSETSAPTPGSPPQTESIPSLRDAVLATPPEAITVPDATSAALQPKPPVMAPVPALKPTLPPAPPCINDGSSGSKKGGGSANVRCRSTSPVEAATPSAVQPPAPTQPRLRLPGGYRLDGGELLPDDMPIKPATRVRTPAEEAIARYEADRERAARFQRPEPRPEPRAVGPISSQPTAVVPKVIPDERPPAIEALFGRRQ